MKSYLSLLVFILFVSAQVQAQSKTKEVIIKTKIYCDHCKECGSCHDRIINELRFTKGVKEASMDVEKQEIKVLYASSKTNEQQIKNAINKAGFDADDQLAPTEFVNKLDDCCKKKE